VNGIMTQKEINKQEFENVIKKASIVYRAHKLQVKKKIEPQS